jgi:hypothetical protein
MKHTITRSLTTVALAGTLGFGAVQALAAPTPASAGRAQVCNLESCNTRCKAAHGPFAHGECWGDECLCAI